MKNVKKKENNIQTKMKMGRIAVVLLVAVIFACYVFYAVYRLVANPTSTFMIEKGKVTLEEEAIGYVIREEQILQGENYKNGLVPIKAEGERAAANEEIFRYYSKGEDTLVKKIQELDVKIQEAVSQENNLLGADVKVLDKEIELKLSEIAQNNNMQKIAEYKKDINKAIDKKARIAGEKSPAGSYLKKLQEERNGYEKQLNSGSEYVRAPVSGTVSYRVDQLENVLTPDKFSSLNKEFFKELNLKTGQVVATSNECGKMVNNFECYIATILEEDKTHDVQLEDKVNVRLSSSEEVEAQIVYMQKQEEETLLVFKIEKGVEELLNYRKISFDVIFWSKEGLKVPNTAIIDEEGIQYVKRNRAGYISKIPVMIKNQNETYSLIQNYTTEELKELGFTADQIKDMSNINLYDEVLAYPEENE